MSTHLGFNCEIKKTNLKYEYFSTHLKETAFIFKCVKQFTTNNNHSNHFLYACQLHQCKTWLTRQCLMTNSWSIWQGREETELFINSYRKHFQISEDQSDERISIKVFFPQRLIDCQNVVAVAVRSFHCLAWWVIIRCYF